MRLFNYQLKKEIVRQFEFEEKVKMQVSQKEYEAIELVYLNSDLGKDEFCRMWVKMNKSRVEKAKEEAKKKREAEEQKNKAWILYLKVKNTIESDFDTWNDYSDCHLNQKERMFLTELGMCSYLQRLGSLRYELAQFLGIA